jgi:hypothetical protein
LTAWKVRRAEGVGGERLRPANAPIFIGGNVLRGLFVGLLHRYRHTSGVGRLGIYLWATGRGSDTTDQTIASEDAVARLAVQSRTVMVHL